MHPNMPNMAKYGQICQICTLYTIVKLPNIELLIAAGDVKEKKEDLKKIARESSRPGVDHRFMFAPLKVRSFDVSV